MTTEEEKNMRERLNKELEDGLYSIGGDTYMALTGKGGYINFLIELHKQAEKFLGESHGE